MGCFEYDDVNKDKDVFAVSGPKHISTQTSIEIDCEEHQRCVLACLVQGAYAMERDRTEARKPLAPEWWKSFHFRLLQTLRCECRLCRPFEARDERRRSIYGAIFEYVPPEGAAAHARHRQSAPRYVIAFRGTIMGPHDLSLDASIVVNQQHRCGHFRKAREQVQEFMKDIADENSNGGCATGNSEVWLAGHSLGASLALDVGRSYMIAERRRNLPTFLFNPPQVSLAPAIDLLPMSEVAKRGLFASSYWRSTSAATLSYRDIGYSVFGKHNDRPHLLPSARLWKNQSSQCKPHELRQWWQPQGSDLELIFNRYSWP